MPPWLNPAATTLFWVNRITRGGHNKEPAQVVDGGVDDVGIGLRSHAHLIPPVTIDRADFDLDRSLRANHEEAAVSDVRR